MYLDYYFQVLGISDIPYFLKKYLICPSLLRLKKISYFCGMDYASKNIYNFREKITRYDHSLSVALLTYKFTKSKKASISGLFHDVATPCFSHVIDYMNGDYANQESTEEYTELIIKNDKYLNNCLRKDKIKMSDIVNFKNYTIVDNNRPKLCSDRIDGIILTGISWTKNIEYNEIRDIVNNLCVYQNEDFEYELGFKSICIANNVVKKSEEIDAFCHSKEDNYMMNLLANLTKYAIDNKYFNYNDLYYYDEEYIINIFENISDEFFKKKFLLFKNIRKDEVVEVTLPYIKKRNISPLCNGKRILKL